MPAELELRIANPRNRLSAQFAPHEGVEGLADDLDVSSDIAYAVSRGGGGGCEARTARFKPPIGRWRGQQDSSWSNSRDEPLSAAPSPIARRPTAGALTVALSLDAKRVESLDGNECPQGDESDEERCRMMHDGEGGWLHHGLPSRE